MNQSPVKTDKDFYTRMSPEQMQSALLEHSVYQSKHLKYQSDQLAEQTSSLKSISTSLTIIAIIVVLATIGSCALAFLMM